MATIRRGEVEQTYLDWFDMATRYAARHSDQRLGQALFNSLNHVNRVLANSVRGSVVDPFFDNQHIPAFINYVEKNWNK